MGVQCSFTVYSPFFLISQKTLCATSASYVSSCIRFNRLLRHFLTNCVSYQELHKSMKDLGTDDEVLKRPVTTRGVVNMYYHQTEVCNNACS